MASIDKIFGTYEQWCEFHQWVANSKRPQYTKYFYPTPPYGKQGPLTIFPQRVDIWLYQNCPLKWVKAAIRFQYNGSPRK